MLIGIPREILHGERRVAMTPETTQRLVAMGAQVVIESGAGAGILASDELYRQAGARIVADPLEVWNSADLVLKVKQPCVHPTLGYHEADVIKQGASLVTFLHPAAPDSHDLVLPAGGPQRDCLHHGRNPAHLPSPANGRADLDEYRHRLPLGAHCR